MFAGIRAESPVLHVELSGGSGRYRHDDKAPRIISLHRDQLRAGPAGARRPTCGNPDGVPALIVHGGPGSGCTV